MERTPMNDIPSPLDHLAAFVLVFGLGVLCAWICSTSLQRLRPPLAGSCRYVPPTAGANFGSP